MRQAETFFDDLFTMLSGILMALIRRLSKFVVAVPPAWYWGTIIHRSSGSLAVGIAAAIVLEIGGMLAAYYAVAYWGTVKGQLSAALTAAYLLIGAGVMWLMEAATTDEKIVITAVFVIAGMVYTLSAMSELEGREMAAIDDDRAWQRGEREKDNETRRQLRLQKQADDTAVSLAQVQAQPAKVSPKETETHVSPDELAGNKLEIYRILRETPKATNTAIAGEIGVSRQYVGQVRKELNGSAK